VPAPKSERFIPYQTTHVAINFNDRVLITNPTSFHLGRSVLIGGIIAITAGVITHFAGEFLMPPSAWIVLGAPPIFIGWIIMRSGLTKN
jgi:hypothetical protein